MDDCIFISNNIITQTLNSSSTKGTNALEPLKSLALTHKLPFKILEDYEVANAAEVHMHEGDLWHCLEGEATFTYGGTLKNPQFRKNPDSTENLNELFAEEIENGTKITLKPGDWLWIPPEQPHQHQTMTKARLMIIKIPKST